MPLCRHVALQYYAKLIEHSPQLFTELRHVGESKAELHAIFFSPFKLNLYRNQSHFIAVFVLLSYFLSYFFFCTMYEVSTNLNKLMLNNTKYQESRAPDAFSLFSKLALDVRCKMY